MNLKCFGFKLQGSTCKKADNSALQFDLVSNLFVHPPIFSKSFIMHPARPCAETFRKGAYFLFISQQHNLGYGDKNAIKTSLPIRAA